MEAIEQAMKSWDGAELFYRGWIPHEATDKAILLFHRGHEHSGRWQETVYLLALKDIAVFAWDARGHGRSPGERGAANNFADVIRDVGAFSRNDSGHRRVSRAALRPPSHSPFANEAKAVRPRPGEELREIEASDSGQKAGRAVRRRPAYLPANCGQCFA